MYGVDVTPATIMALVPGNETVALAYSLRCFTNQNTQHEERGDCGAQQEARRDGCASFLDVDGHSSRRLKARIATLANEFCLLLFQRWKMYRRCLYP